MSAKDAPIARRSLFQGGEAATQRLVKPPTDGSNPSPGATLIGVIDRWRVRADYIAQRADLVRNFDRWLQLRAAAEMWERQYGDGS